MKLTKKQFEQNMEDIAEQFTDIIEDKIVELAKSIMLDKRMQSFVWIGAIEEGEEASVTRMAIENAVINAFNREDTYEVGSANPW
jgi:hypothetical protein